MWMLAKWMLHDNIYELVSCYNSPIYLFIVLLQLLYTGTEYFICFVEPLKINSKQRSSSGTSSANNSLNTTSNTSVFSPGLAMGKNHPHSSHNAKISAISADAAVNMNAGVLEGETTSGKSEKNTNLSLQNPNHTPNA